MPKKNHADAEGIEEEEAVELQVSPEPEASEDDPMSQGEGRPYSGTKELDDQAEGRPYSGT